MAQKIHKINIALAGEDFTLLESLALKQKSSVASLINKMIKDQLAAQQRTGSNNATETITADGKQYNSVAKTFSELAEEHNKDSIQVYFRYLDFPLKEIKILDLGCGDGYDLSQLRLKDSPLLFGIDSSEEMVRRAQANNPDAMIKLGYCEDIPFEDHLFDVVISKWTFHTSPKIDPIYREIARVLKPQGKLIFLSSHPIRQFIEKKRKGKNYFKKELVESTFFDGMVTVKEPSHTLNEYLSPTFFEHFVIESYEEGNDSGSEKVEGDIYPTFFIIKARLKAQIK